VKNYFENFDVTNLLFEQVVFSYYIKGLKQYKIDIVSDFVFILLGPFL